MCEPYHSVSQWPSENAVAAVLENVPAVHSEIGAAPTLLEDETTNEQRLIFVLGENSKTLSKVCNFFHLSTFGSGHHEARASRLGQKNGLVPRSTDYQIHWWDRQIKFDGDLTFPRNVVPSVQVFFRKEALEACTEYAKRTSIGSPKVLRRFLEQTILETEHLSQYEASLFKLFTPKGKDEFKYRLGRAELVIPQIGSASEAREIRIRLVKVVAGMTRLRNLLVPEWADAKEFWMQK